MTAGKRQYSSDFSNRTTQKVLWQQLESLNVKALPKISIPSAISDPDYINKYFINSIPKMRIERGIRLYRE